MRNVLIVLCFALVACGDNIVPGHDIQDNPQPLVCHADIVQIDASGVGQNGPLFCSARIELSFDCGDDTSPLTETSGKFIVGWTDGAGHSAQETGSYTCHNIAVTESVDIPCGLLESEGPKAFKAMATVGDVTCE